MHGLLFLGGKWRYFQKFSLGSETSDMTYEGLEMFEGDDINSTLIESKNIAVVSGQP